MSRFIIIIPQATPEQSQVIQNRFFEGRAYWWHWSSDVWLLKLTNENPTADQLKEEILRALPAAHFLVFSADNSFFAGWGPTEWKNWFAEFWK